MELEKASQKMLIQISSQDQLNQQKILRKDRLLKINLNLKVTQDKYF